jgi:hypothetical protein
MIIEMPLCGSDELLGDERRRVTVLPYKPKGYVSLASRLFVAIKDHGPRAILNRCRGWTVKSSKRKES